MPITALCLSSSVAIWFTCVHFRSNFLFHNDNTGYQHFLKVFFILKLSKATGLDKISAKLLNDAASIIAKPVTYLINLTIFTGEIPSQWKEARVTLI